MIICPLPCVNACEFEYNELVKEAYNGERCPYFKYKGDNSLSGNNTPLLAPSQPRDDTNDKPGIVGRGGR